MIRNFRVSLAAFCLVGICSGVTGADTPREIAKRVSPSVVLLVMEDASGQLIATASGFVVRKGIVATNMHAIQGASRAHAKLSNKETKHDIRGVVAFDPDHDLVLLAIDSVKAAPLPIGDSNKVAVGDTVYAVGNPHGLVGTFSSGMVSAVRKIDEDLLFQITAPISYGSSGGPVVDSKGEVVGIVVSTVEGGQNLNFVIPASYLISLLSSQGPAQPLDSSEIQKNASDAASDSWNKFVENKRKAAEQGNADAMVDLGMIYVRGQGVPQDYQEAANWFRKAAKKGNAVAMAMLGAMHSDGQGMPQDYRKAAGWYRKAAEKGSAFAMASLGSLYSLGHGVSQDYREAVKWYHQAAEKGVAHAMFMLGIAYHNGEG
ncbi:MAG: hypothetical protein DRP83_03880, partial [Planctomycetota bacterium]